MKRSPYHDRACQTCGASVGEPCRVSGAADHVYTDGWVHKARQIGGLARMGGPAPAQRPRIAPPSREYPPQFAGDGRVKVQARCALPGTLAAPISRGAARALIDKLMQDGHSTHSARGATLWVVLEHCTWARLPYTLRVSPGYSYYLELKG